MMYEINEQECFGCQACIRACPGAVKINKNGKMEIIDQRKLEQCGGESVCPMGVIKKIDKEQNRESNEAKRNIDINQRIDYDRRMRFSLRRRMGYGNGRRGSRKGKRT